MKMKMTIIVAVLLMALNAAAGLSSVDVIAKTLYHEARGEGETGIRAVATIIHNRTLKSNGKVTSDLCAKEAKKKAQFSCWNGKKDLKAGKDKSWETCVQVAKEIDAGKFKRTHGYTHYYAFKICNPKWAKGKKGYVIGNHKFLNA